MLVCFAFFGVARAQETVEIGDSESTTTNYTLPVNMYYHYSLTQQIYTAEEIGMAGTITSIAFDYTYSGSFSMEGVQMYMMNVDKESFESNTDIFYSAATTPPASTRETPTSSAPLPPRQTSASLFIATATSLIWMI